MRSRQRAAIVAFLAGCAVLVATSVGLASGSAPMSDGEAIAPAAATTPSSEQGPPTREIATGTARPGKAYTGQYSPEYRLAILESQGLIPEGNPSIKPNDPLVRAFAQQLDAIAPKCLEDRSKLADLTVIAHNALASRGIHATRLAILSDVSGAVPSSRLPMRCDGEFANRTKQNR
jgi:hypothetical protein